MLDLLADDLMVAIDAMRVDRFQDGAACEPAGRWIAEPGAIGTAPPVACLTSSANAGRRSARQEPQRSSGRAVAKITLDVVGEYVDAVGGQLEVNVGKGRHTIPLIS